MSEERQTEPPGPPGRARLRLTWLGQAGFAIAAADGFSCLVDPYLSDWCARHSNNPRVPPIALDPSTVRPTLVVTSHWHDDHLDPEAIPVIARCSPRTVFAGPPSCGVRYRWWGVSEERIVVLRQGESATVGPARVTAGFARHEVPGMLTEDAISIILEIDGRRIFHSGDTEYDTRILAVRSRGPIDVGLFVINGGGGNMNLREAAFLAAELEAGLAIPMHYGMWRKEKYGPGATLDPEEFVRRFRALSRGRAMALKHAEPIEIA